MAGIEEMEGHVLARAAMGFLALSRTINRDGPLFSVRVEGEGCSIVQVAVRLVGGRSHITNGQEPRPRVLKLGFASLHGNVWCCWEDAPWRCFCGNNNGNSGQNGGQGRWDGGGRMVKVLVSRKGGQKLLPVTTAAGCCH